MNIRFKNLAMSKKYFLITSIVFFLLSLPLIVYFLALALDQNNPFAMPWVISLFCAVFVGLNCAIYLVFALQYSFYPERLKKDTILFLVVTVATLGMLLTVLANNIDHLTQIPQNDDKYFYVPFSYAAAIFLAVTMILYLVKCVWKVIMKEETYQKLFDDLYDDSQPEPAPMPKGKKAAPQPEVVEYDEPVQYEEPVQQEVQPPKAAPKAAPAASKSAPKKATATDDKTTAAKAKIDQKLNEIKSKTASKPVGTATKSSTTKTTKK